MQNRLYVGNFVEELAASTLQEWFEPHGLVTEVKLACKRGAGLPGALNSVAMARMQTFAPHSRPGGDA